MRGDLLKLSTKSRYGLKAMIDLAVYSDGKYISLKNIAKRQDIPEAYLEQLIASLKKSGLVNSIRGATGGYILSKACEDISIGSILRALEGNISSSDCYTKSKCKSDCGCCVTKSVWLKLSESLNTTADNMYLIDLVQDYKKINDI